MTCPTCNTANADSDQFCVGCGNELANAPAVAKSSSPVTHPATMGPIVATLTYNGINTPLVDGSKVVIAREDTDRCKPDLPIKGGSGTPIEVSVDNGEIKVHDTGTSIGTRVVVYLPPGASMVVKPGDMLMLGDQVISIG